MNEHPILFSTEMVLANLNGRKTNTRRLTGLHEINENPDLIEFLKIKEFNDGSYRAIFLHKLADDPGSIKCPYGKPGDLLWVRETWCLDLLNRNVYKATDGLTDGVGRKFSFTPSIHMPKAAARIWIQVEEIRVERLQDISEEDMISEGVVIPVSELNTPLFVIGTANSAFSFLPDGCLADGATPPTKKQILFAFWAELWCKINGRESWDANPWVWVVKYKVISTTGKPQICYKTNELCKYDCKGLCRESM